MNTLDQQFAINEARAERASDRNARRWAREEEVEAREARSDRKSLRITEEDITAAFEAFAAAAPVESAEKATLRYVAHKLGSDARWAEKAITLLYGFQTAEEQDAGSTREHNGQGFNGTDAELLSSFAVQIARSTRPEGERLSPKQRPFAFRKLPKYARQVAGAVDPAKAASLTLKAVDWAAANPPAPKAKKAPKAE